jgi:hypothetical protein
VELALTDKVEDRLGEAISENKPAPVSTSAPNCSPKPRPSAARS